MAAFFTEIQYTDRKLQKSGLIRDDPRVALEKLENGDKLRAPRFLGDSGRMPESAVPHRQAFAQWMTAADNPYFARAMVNRMWAQMFGRGLVDPVDDMHPQNPPTHPELLSELSARFIASGFNLTALCRDICNSDAYQRTSRPAAGNERDTALYSHMAVKVLTPEQLYDSLSVILPGAGDLKGSARRSDPREEFVEFFRSDSDATPLVYDRGIPQLLRMMNSPQFLSPRTEAAAVQEIVKPGTSETLAIERLYLHVLARRPTEDERPALQEFLTGHPGTHEQAYAEILWALVNESEFSLNH
jgi:hypothetical protein